MSKYKHFTDGKTVVQADHRAGAFDALQEIYGHADIGDIFTAVRVDKFYNPQSSNEKRLIDSYLNLFTFNPNELQWTEESKKWD
jgi:hypothetical protein